MLVNCLTVNIWCAYCEIFELESYTVQPSKFSRRVQVLRKPSSPFATLSKISVTTTNTADYVYAGDPVIISQFVVLQSFDSRMA